MMNIKVISTKENPLIGRKEIEFEVEYQKPLKREEILDALSKLGFEKNLIVIRKIKNVTGVRKSVGIAHEYKDENSLTKFEPKFIIKRWKEHGKEKEKKEQETKQ